MIKIDDGDAGSLDLNQEYYLPMWFYPQVARNVQVFKLEFQATKLPTYRAKVDSHE